MPIHEELEALSTEELATINGGINIGGLANSIGGLVDQFAGTGGKATQIAGQIGGLVSGLVGGG